MRFLSFPGEVGPIYVRPCLFSSVLNRNVGLAPPIQLPPPSVFLGGFSWPILSTFPALVLLLFARKVSQAYYELER